MPTEPVYIAQGTPAATSTPTDVVERASTDIITTTTADPSTGTSLAVTSRSLFPQSGSFKIRVEAEVMLVTAGHGTGAGTFTVTRGQDGTTNVAHASGVSVAQVVGVQRVEPVDASKQNSYSGRVCTFRTPGRAGTGGQKVLAIHNSSSSTVNVDVVRINVDVLQAAAAGIAPTVIPPVIRLWKFTAVPTNGSALTKVPDDSVQSSKSTVTVWGDASADGTGSGTTLTITLPAGTFLSEEYAPRMLVVGTSATTLYEPFDRTTFPEAEDLICTLRPGEGLAVFLDYTVAAGNPTSSHWIGNLRWREWTAA